MKRYWKLVVLVPLIVLCIGTYYAEATDGNYPEYYLKSLGGNEKEASQVSLQAVYRNESVSINSEGSEYRNEQSFWESLASNYYNSKELEKLEKEHRQFMRGKRGDPNAFYEDDRIVGYANIKSQFTSAEGLSDFRFTVSVYDKKQKDSSSFEVKVPKENVYNSISLGDVQIDGQTIKLVTINYKRNESNPGHYMNPEVHLYTLDQDKKNVTEDQVILSGASPDENNRVEIMGAYETEPTKQSRYAVFQMAHSKKEMTTESSETYATDKRELFVYDMESGKLETIQSQPINELLKGTDELDIRQSGDDLFLMSRTDPKSPRVIRYSLAEKKVKNDLTLSFKDLQSNAGRVDISRFVAISNNRLYMLGNTRKDGLPGAPTVVIAELETGGIVYQGIVSRKDNKELSNFMIGNIAIK